MHSASLGQGVRFCFSSISLISRVLRKILEEKIDHLIIVTAQMVNSALVCTTSKNVCTGTIASVSCNILANKSTGQKSPSSRNRVTEISGAEGSWKSLQMEGISSNAGKHISHSMRKSSTTNYESAWGQWISWFNERKVNPFQAPVNYIISFLSEKFDKGLQRRTLNSL